MCGTDLYPTSTAVRDPTEEINAHTEAEANRMKETSCFSTRTPVQWQIEISVTELNRGELSTPKQQQQQQQSSKGAMLALLLLLLLVLLLLLLCAGFGLGKFLRF